MWVAIPGSSRKLWRIAIVRNLKFSFADFNSFKNSFGLILAKTKCNCKGECMSDFRTYDLSVKFYQLAQEVQMPRHLKDQLNRASSSVTLNLAEGNAKFSYKDKARIYQIAYGSFRECQAIFDLTQVEDRELLNVSKHLGSSLYRLIESTLKYAKKRNPERSPDS